MQTFRVFIAVTALIVLVPSTPVLFAQQTSPYIENAKKEGEVVWYGTLTGGSIVGRILKTFEDKYPSIKVKYLRLGGAGLIERIRSEARSGKYRVDQRHRAGEILWNIGAGIALVREFLERHAVGFVIARRTHG